MATNHYLGFSEDGTELFEMKSKLARQVGDDVSATVKTAIRATLGVPASAEGLVPGNDLSDVDDVPTARSNLSVYSKDETNDRFLDRAPSNAAVLGSNGYAAPAGALSATALQDTFTIIVDVRFNSVPSAQAKFMMITSSGTTSGASHGEMSIESDGAIDYSHYDGSSDVLTSVVPPSVELGKVYRLTYRVDSSDEGLTAFVDGVKGSSVATGAGSSANYRVHFGTSDQDNSGTEILGYKILNEALSDADCALWGKRGAVPEEYQWGKADQATNGTFASDVSWTKGAGWTIGSGVASCASGSTDLEQAQFASAIVDHRYRVTFTVSNFSAGTIQPLAGATAGTARSANGTYSEILTYASGTNLIFRSASFVGDIDDVILEELGVTDSGQPQNIESDGWVDETSNERNLTFTTAAPIMPLPQTSGTFAPTLEFGGASVGITYSTQQGQWRKIDENLYFVRVRLQLSANGSSTGSAVLLGMPFSSKAISGSYVVAMRMHNTVGLTRTVIGLWGASGTTIGLYEQGATAFPALDDTNFTATTLVEFNMVVETS